MLFLTLSILVVRTFAWPDGAPCVHAAFESMNPLEAVEHQGGLQLTSPPYEIKVDQKCYWRNQPIALTLQGINDTIWFKGFVIQPYRWNNDQLGPRIGQIVRLDDNGSWRQQCFTEKASATHSHNEKKKHMRMWWKVDDESDTVQFVATVVKHQTMFWVRSVVSKPIPPCRLNRNGFDDYSPPLPTQPPPVKGFKMETNRFFGNDGNLAVGPFLLTESTTPRPTLPTTAFVRPVSTSPRMQQIIPLEDLQVLGRHKFNTQPHRHSIDSTALRVIPVTTQTSAFTLPIQTTTTPTITTTTPEQRNVLRTNGQLTQSQQFQRQRLIASNRRFQNNGRNQPRPVFRPVPNNQVCEDRDSIFRCQQWIQFCRTPRSFAYLSINCRKTCRFC
ncbi:unnamed protein product [Auanema sp. JU1783]|nr:unnamed protein product [Auanema sp. JU1783]